MIIKIKDIDINYIQYGKGNDVVLLHGWGQNIAMMDPIGKALADDFKITIIDLPGFGNSSQPLTPLTLFEYYEILDVMFKQLKITKPILIGHSFGGRLALIYASQQEVNKLILFGTPFEKKIKKESLKLKLLKLMKKIPIINKLEDTIKKHIGSTDYRNANPVMRKILVNTVNEDLTEYAKDIKCPTILIWGSEDNQVSIDEAERLEQLINNCGLIIYPGLTHYAYLENLIQTNNIIKSFLITKK